MLEDASNRELLDAWRSGNQGAATVLVRRYMARLTSLASSRLSRKLAQRLDAEDVVLSAWRSFFVATGRDQVDVPDDDNLWPLLVTMTLRKLSRQAARHTAERRSIHAEMEPSDELNWPAIVSRDPTPAEAAMVTDEIENMMSGLALVDREILTKRLQGERHATIADAVSCSERTVRRSLQRIRERYLAAGRSRGDLSSQDEGSDIPTGDFPTTSSIGTFAADISGGPTQPAADPAAKRPIPEGPTVQFRDVVLERLAGQGAFGKVYQATRCGDGASVAVKFLRKVFWKNGSAADQLIREVAIVSKQPLVEIIECGIAVGGALAAAHDAGIVHADLTPRNILRRSDGTFVLTDFGFSRLVGGGRSNVTAGTPGFLAPEQISDAFGTISPQTDVFGLGGVLYYLLTGQPPFAGRDVAETFAQTLSSRPADRVSSLAPAVNLAVDELVACCLGKEPNDRPNSITTVLEQLARIEFDQTM